jgi:hypothetical protein
MSEVVESASAHSLLMNRKSIIMDIAELEPRQRPMVVVWYRVTKMYTCALCLHRWHMSVIMANLSTTSRHRWCCGVVCYQMCVAF